MRQLLIGLIILIFSSQPTHAAVIINEISPRTDPEWVELYNPSPETVDLTAYYLIDKANNKESLSTLGVVSPNTYVLFSRPKGWLNDTTDDLYLFSSPDNLVDSLSYPSIEENKSVARIPNITGSWLTNQSLTPGYSNDPPVFVSPSPSISSSPSPTPNYSPVVAIVPSPSPSPSLLPSPSISPSPSVTPKPSSLSASPSDAGKTPSPLTTPSTGTVAGEAKAIDLSGFGVSPSPYLQLDKLDESSPHAPSLNKARAKTAIIFGSGLILISVSGYFGYREYQKRHIITK